MMLLLLILPPDLASLRLNQKAKQKFQTLQMFSFLILLVFFSSLILHVFARPLELLLLELLIRLFRRPGFHL